MTAPTFPVPTFPADTFRRTWLAEALQDRATGEKFFHLLEQIAPAKARRVGPGRARAAYQAVCEAITFPIEDHGDLEALFYGEDTLESLWWHGIPVDVQGYHPDIGSAVLDVAAMTRGGTWVEDPDGSYTLQQDKLTRWAWSWWTKPADAARRRPIRAPRGREFIPPWNGLADLACYVTASTGNDWLDLNFEEMDGGQNPPWTAPEIRSLARRWEQARPMAERVQELADYIAEELRERLPLMDRALRGDPEALRTISRPKTPRSIKAFWKRHR